MSQFRFPWLLAAFGVVAASNSVEASGFYIRESSTSAMATSFAGASARGLDPSHLFFNPATIVDNPGTNYTLDVRTFFPDAKIDVSSATDPQSVDVSGRGNSGSLAGMVIAPGQFSSHALSDSLFVGVGSSAPFGLKIESNNPWAGEFQFARTDIRSRSVNPVIAFRPEPWAAFAVGLNAQQLKVDLRRTEIVPAFIPPFGLVLNEAVGFLRGHDIAFGFTAGLLLQPTDDLRIGLGYRSEVNHTLDGTLGVEIAGTREESVEFDVTTPQSVSLGVEKKISPKVALLGEVQWTEWSVFKGLVVKFDSGLPTQVRPQDWRDVWFVAGGVRITVNDQTEISAGVSFDQSISNVSANTLSPDSDRIGVGFGITRRTRDNATWRLSYEHIFVKDAPIDIANKSGTLAANLEASADVVGFSVTFHR